MIFRIMRKELEILFYSPIAWFLLVLFALQTGLEFTNSIMRFVVREGGGPGISMYVFTKHVWAVVQEYLYYYIPLLTMGVVSRELSTGSIKLLYSSPVKNREIILGKYLGMVAYAGVMFFILLIYIMVGGFFIKDFEWATVFVGWFGLFLLTCTYMAIGVFVSSLTTYQFIAALGTFAILMGLSAIYNVGQGYDVVRDITYWLCISGRASTFVSGMICSEDLLYFILVPTLFISLTIIRLKAIRQKEAFRKTSLKYVSVVLAVCFCGYLSSRPMLMGYYDATNFKVNSITPTSQEVVAKLKGDLEINGYVNVVSSSYNTYRFPWFVMLNRTIFEKFVRFKPDTDLKLVYYYDTITDQDNPYMAKIIKENADKKNLDLEGLMEESCIVARLDPEWVKTPEEVKEMTDLTGNRTFVWEIILNGEKRTWLHTYVDKLTTFPAESEITAALSRLVEKAPKIAFVTGHGMRSIQDYDVYGYSQFGKENYRQFALYNLGFDVVELSLEQEIPDDVNVLTLADMKTPLSSIEEEHLRKYIERGGNLFILGEPRRREVMNPLLDKYFGVELTAGNVVQYRRNDLTPDILCAPMTEASRKLSPFYAALYLHFPTTAGIVKVAERGFAFTPLAQSDTLAKEEKVRGNHSYRVWNELESMDYAKSSLTYNPEAGEEEGTYTPMVALTRQVDGREQRVVITGDADCISNGVMPQQNMATNSSILLGTCHYLSDAARPIMLEMVKTNRFDNDVFFGMGGWQVLRVVFVWVLPLLFVAVGVFVWFRRRSR